MNFCYSETSKPESSLGQSVSWDLASEFYKDFDLLTQHPCSVLALNNRQSNNFWCITEKE